MPVNVGTWYVKAIVADTCSYNGLDSIRAFTITAKDIKDGNITISKIDSDKDTDKFIVKDGDRELVKGTDYDVKIKRNGNETTVTITFMGNYAGTIEKIYTVDTSQPDKPEQELQDMPKHSRNVKKDDSTQAGLLAIFGMISAGCISLLAKKK